MDFARTQQAIDICIIAPFRGLQLLAHDPPPLTPGEELGRTQRAEGGRRKMDHCPQERLGDVHGYGVEDDLPGGAG